MLSRAGVAAFLSVAEADGIIHWISSRTTYAAAGRSPQGAGLPPLEGRRPDTWRGDDMTEMVVKTRAWTMVGVRANMSLDQARGQLS